MAQSLQELKKNRKSRFDNLKDKVENMNQGGSSKNNDERFWYPAVDQSGNGFAIIRFLDAPMGEDEPFVRVFSHGFKGPNGWYIENSLTTIGKQDPVSDYNRRLWNSGFEHDKQIAREQKRKVNYYSNIYVIKDPANPENEGKTFLFRFGKKIHDKIMDKMSPQFEDEEPINVFDFWEGCNFRLKIRNVDGYRNYDKSTFDSPSEIFESDEEIKKTWESEYSLKTFVSEENFKSYSDLKARLDKIMGFDTQAENLYRPGDTPTSNPTTNKTAEESFEKQVSQVEQDYTDSSSSDSSSESNTNDEEYFDDILDKI